MHLNSVDLNLFVVFDVIYSERNLTRAADILHLTQPTVSNALSRLRKTFNDELFIRTPQGMLPTPVAENSIGQVRQALQLMGTSLMQADTFDPACSDRTFRVSMNDVTEALLLPELMGEIAQLAPGMSIESYYTRRREQSLALSSGQLELVIDIAEAVDNNLCHTHLFSENYVCVVRKDHPVIRKKLTLKQYLSLGHIHVSSRPHGLGVVDLALGKMGFQRQINLRLQHYLVAPEIVQRTDLALTVPSYWARKTDLKLLKLPFELPVQESHLLWHKSADGDKANRWLRERIIALCPERMSG